MNLYGTDEELEEFNQLIKNPQVERNLYAMALIIEEIKRRNFLKMSWHCCWRCQYFATCKINWYRGERKMERRNCCTYCQNFWECHKRFNEEADVSDATTETKPETPPKDPGTKP
ncbi:MAG TPA: hypothetical protein PKO06_01870 [Candidatus Ozemobacteraceae bacterium]|nr:hypothetical protein [Candidatus Ozemobacteraceae bacterium]